MPGFQDTIAAIATAPGVGAIGVIRLSGPDAIVIANLIFKGKDLTRQPTHTAHFGHITDDKGAVIDEVLVTLFRDRHSYTGENTVEISGHGSPYILNRILDAALKAGARMAAPGEYTQRAFLNGKMDLTQAEAVADLIAANSKAAQETALKQLRGGFSSDLKTLRDELIHFTALIELELDFSDEDVAFADRTQFRELLTRLQHKTDQLVTSFQLGNAIKNGISVAIVGKPNAGKSTLLNALLNEDRAIVSAIAGTTRDTIEEALNIKGVLFRLIDTAGLRTETTDIIEQIGVGKSRQKLKEADIVLYLFDAATSTRAEIEQTAHELEQDGIRYLLLANKTDLPESADLIAACKDMAHLFPLSAMEGMQVEALKEALFNIAIGGQINIEDTIVTNARHHDALVHVQESLAAIRQGMDSNLSGDLLAPDIRQCLYYLGLITGQVEIDRDILGTIFGKFCIGK